MRTSKAPNSGAGTLVNATTPEQPTLPKQSTQSFSEVLNNFVTNWDKAQRESQAKISKLPGDYRGLLELQLAVHRLNLSSELVSRAGEAASGTVKKLQQMGSN